MNKFLLIIAFFTLSWAPSYAEDTEEEAVEPEVKEVAKPNGDGISNPKTMSGSPQVARYRALEIIRDGRFDQPLRHARRPRQAGR